MDRERAETARQLALIPPERASAPAGALRFLVLAGAEVLRYRLVRRARAPLSVRVAAEGVRVCAAPRTPLGEIESFLREHAQWIARELAKGTPRRFHGADGETLPVAGREVTVRVRAGAPLVRLADERLEVSVPEPLQRDTVRAALVAWFAARTRERIAPLVLAHAQVFGRAPACVAVSHARCEWGSCAAGGRVRLAWRLAMLAEPLADYVAAHEAAHLVELNHSPRFWALVARRIPDWRERRAELARVERILPLFA